MTALAHECAHAERRDFKKNLCYEVVSLMLAFHPAVWAVKAQIAQTREMVCDRMVAERVLDARAYAQSLLRLAGLMATSPRAAAVNAIGIFDANILEKRVMMMNRKIRHDGFMLRYGLMIPAVLLLASTWIAVAAKAVVIEPAATAGSEQASTSGPVYKVGDGVSAPVPLHTVDAAFPKSGLKIKAPFNEIVLVRLVVDKNGKPQNVHVATSFNSDFDRAAVKAVKQYQFKPAMRLGEPVPVALTIEVNFKEY
jgi:TonB family protein